MLYITSPSESKQVFLLTLLIETLSFVLNSIVWLLTKTKYKSYLIIMIIVLNTLNLVMQSINFDHMISHRSEQRFFEFDVKLTDAKYALQALLLAPSLGIELVYLAYYLLMISAILILTDTRDVEDSMIKSLWFSTPVIVSCLAIIFTVFHKRELKRFEQLRKAENNRD